MLGSLVARQGVLLFVTEQLPGEEPDGCQLSAGLLGGDAVVAVFMAGLVASPGPAFS
jgi:hypothetical protein